MILGFLTLFGIIIFFIIKIIKNKRKEKKLNEEKEKMTNEELEEEYHKRIKNHNHSFQPVFSEKLDVPEEEYVSINELDAFMAEENRHLDTQINKDIQSLIKELKRVKEKMEKVRRYGLNLANLFEKYKKRETQLEYMINHLREMMEYGRK